MAVLLHVPMCSIRLCKIDHLYHMMCAGSAKKIRNCFKCARFSPREGVHAWGMGKTHRILQRTITACPSLTYPLSTLCYGWTK